MSLIKRKFQLDEDDFAVMTLMTIMAVINNHTKEKIMYLHNLMKLVRKDGMRIFHCWCSGGMLILIIKIMVVMITKKIIMIMMMLISLTKISVTITVIMAIIAIMNNF